MQLMVQHTDLSFMDKFEPVDLKVAETDYWIVTLRRKQITIGSCVIAAKEGPAMLSDLSPAAAADLPKVAKEFEARTAKAFGAAKYNYIAAMMKDPFVHLHAIPRYAGTVDFGGRAWIDAAWPAVASLDAVECSDAEVDAILAAMRSA
jgi:diadenosine tetraphosphate (Ap4A) HIT family hydrolase